MTVFENTGKIQKSMASLLADVILYLFLWPAKREITSALSRESNTGLGLLNF